jgi:replicative DNA helicase
VTDGNRPASREPPYSVEAEQAVLGAVLLNPDAGLRLAGQLEEGMFFREAHRRLFRVMVGLVKRGSVIDPLTLKVELEQVGALEAVGGVDYLSYLLDVVPTAANLDYHAQIVRDKALLRRLIEVGTQIVQDAYEGRRPPDAICEAAESRIFAVAEQRASGSSFESLRTLLWPAMAHVEAASAIGEQVTGVASGFRDLDLKTAGFQSSDLVVVASRPGVGKTAFCLNVAQYAAIEHGVGVAIFSLEMSKDALVQRMLAAEARVDAQRLRTGTLRDSDYTALAQAAGVLSAAPIWIDDAPALTLLELRAKARRHAAEEKGVGLIIVDYLQLMRDPEYRENRVQEVSAITRGLKALAKEMAVPVVALSQLSRGSEARTGALRRPQLSDLRDSGSIEQDADTVLLLYRPEMHAKNDEERQDLEGQAEVNVAKQRNGPTGMVRLHFHAQYTRFESHSGREDARGEQQSLVVVPDLRRPTRTGGGDDE